MRRCLSTAAGVSLRVGNVRAIGKHMEECLMTIVQAIGKRTRLAAAAAGVLLFGHVPVCAAGDALWGAITGGKFSANLRYRLENVDQAGIPLDANASTLRTRFGYLTGGYYGLSLFVQGENVVVVGPQDYNDTINGKTRYPVVADPPLTTMDQAFLQYSAVPDTVLRLGRQRIKLDNDRWIGNVGFRQNEQTYDAATAVNHSLPDTSVTYGYIANVHRIFGPDSPIGHFRMDSHLLNVAYRGLGLGTLTGYAYLLGFDTAPALSTATYGMRFTGAHRVGQGIRLLYTGEYARQVAYRNNPSHYALNYFLGEAGAGYGPFIVKLGYEVLEGNGTQSVQTPLATLHAFDGWADVFLTTPANGLEDRYVTGGAGLMGIDLLVTYHDFAANKGSSDYGTEWDFQAKKTFTRRYTVGLTFANFNAARNVPFKDVRKLWLWGQMRFSTL